MSVLITGGSSGIGAACARAFAAEGYDIVLLARRLEKLTSLAGELTHDHRIQVHAFQHDVRDPKGFETLMRSLPDVMGKVDILINSAGLARGRSAMQEGQIEDWDEMIDTNVKGLLYVTRALLPQLITRKGHIINLGSAAGHWTYPGGNIYSATKYAVHAVSESLRMDLLGTGVRVTEISPGMVETEFSEVRFGDKQKAKAVYAGMTPLTPENIADIILWCVKQPRHVNIQDVVIFPTDQAGVGLVSRKE